MIIGKKGDNVKRYREEVSIVLLNQLLSSLTGIILTRIIY